MAQQTQIKDITITNYSEKSFVVRGETRPHKDTIKALGGKWNSNLKDGAGWIFPTSRQPAVKEWLLTGKNSGETTAATFTPRANSTFPSVDLSHEIRSLHKKLDILTKLVDKDSKHTITVKVTKGKVISIGNLPTGWDVKVSYDGSTDTEVTEVVDTAEESVAPLKRLLRKK